jgi:Ca2+-binding RTX toxin-like protein
MRPIGLVRLAVLSLIVLVVANMASSMAAGNAVPPSLLGRFTDPIDANDLKPPECAANVLTEIQVGSGLISRDGDAALVIGSAGDDVINGGGGNDCIVAGGGNDVVDGKNGDDVILGGPGGDEIDGGAKDDACYGGPGADVFNHCETIVP